MLPARNLTANQALQQLLSGNRRFVAAGMQHPNQSDVRRKQVASRQAPLAIVIGCSDSRVPPEVIFDQGLGDLFVIRLMGNLVDNLALASVEYAVQYLEVPLALVLGHGRCAGVTVAVEVLEKGAAAPGYIHSLVEAVWPAVLKARGQAGDLVENTIRANVAQVVERLKGARPVLDMFVLRGRLNVVGARYDLDTGVVELIT